MSIHLTFVLSERSIPTEALSIWQPPKVKHLEILLILSVAFVRLCFCVLKASFCFFFIWVLKNTIFLEDAEADFILYEGTNQSLIIYFINIYLEWRTIM